MLGGRCQIFHARGESNCGGWDGSCDCNDNCHGGQGGSTRSTTRNNNNIQTTIDSIIMNGDNADQVMEQETVEREQPQGTAIGSSDRMFYYPDGYWKT